MLVNPSVPAHRVFGQRAPGQPWPWLGSDIEISHAFCLGLVDSLLKLDFTLSHTSKMLGLCSDRLSFTGANNWARQPREGVRLAGRNSCPSLVGCSPQSSWLTIAMSRKGGSRPFTARAPRLLCWEPCCGCWGLRPLERPMAGVRGGPLALPGECRPPAG